MKLHWDLVVLDSPFLPCRIFFLDGGDEGPVLLVFLLYRLCSACSFKCKERYV